MSGLSVIRYELVLSHKTSLYNKYDGGETSSIQSNRQLTSSDTGTQPDPWSFYIEYQHAWEVEELGEGTWLDDVHVGFGWNRVEGLGESYFA